MYNKFFSKKIDKDISDIQLSKQDYRSYKKYVMSAKKRGYEFSISKNQFRHVIKSDCAYCGKSPREYSEGTLRMEM